MLGPRFVIPCVGMSMWMSLNGFAQTTGDAAEDVKAPFVCVLGIAQDGGYPQAGCRKVCCQPAWEDPAQSRWVVSLAVVDPVENQRWLIECTPDFKFQLQALDQLASPDDGLGLDGIFLTHAHIGHYAGLIHLGREVIGSQEIPVYAMPRMHEFLRTSGPWNQLVELKNIELRTLAADRPVLLNSRLAITPLVVPHRDEFSETVAFRIEGPNRAVLFLPDIDKWDRWETRVEDELARVDVAYLDATFFDGDELPGRDMSEIPHPFVVESLQRFQPLDRAVRGKIRLIHFNHTNPLLHGDSRAAELVRAAGIGIAQQLEIVGL